MRSQPPSPASIADRLEALLERTARMHRLTAHLSTAVRVSDVAQIVIDEGATALGAMSAALWQLDHAPDRLVLVRASNYSAEALAQVESLPLDPNVPIADAVIRREPVWLSSREDYETRYGVSASRTRSIGPQAYSVAALPIVFQEQTFGVLAFTFVAERPFDDDERSYLAVLALHCAQGFERSRLYELERTARSAAEAAHERALFMSRASALLGSSLDYEETLRNVASLAVPTIGDWCGIDLLEPDGQTKRVAVAHVDPAKIEMAHELRKRYPPDDNAKTGVPHVLRTGESELYGEIPEELLVAGTKDAEHLRLIRELGLRSVLVVAIKDRGAVLGAISFVLANSDRRYTADDLRMAEQLAERAGAAISNAKLYAAAREAIQMRDDFMLVAGHEFRTPLASLSLHHEALISTRDGTPLDKIRERGFKLQSQTQRLTRLVEDLLDVSRISAGRLTLEAEEFELGSLVREIGERMQDDFERARSPVRFELEDVRGRWDRARIEQIITNLLENAAKYGRGAPVEVRVQRCGDTAQLRVTDQGIGISPEDQPRIFRRFERAAPARKFGGLGLGLWIASQLVTAHRGAIEVQSELGSGATFTVTLPLG